MCSASYYSTARLSNAQLIDPKTPRSTSQEIIDLVTTFGDSFVSECNLGSQYFAVYTCFTESREEQETLKTEISAKGGLGALSAQGSSQANVTSLTSSFTKRVKFQQTMVGVGPEVVFPDENGIESFALSFSQKCSSRDYAAITSIITSGYESVQYFTNGYDQLSWETVCKNRDFINKSLIPDSVSILSLSNQMNNIVNFYESRNYDYTNFDSKFAKTYSDLKDDLKTLGNVLEYYKYNLLELLSTSSLLKSFPKSLGNGIPVVSIEKSSVIFGNKDVNNQNVQHFDDFPEEVEYDPRNSTITYLRLNGGTSYEANKTIMLQVIVEYNGSGNKIKHGLDNGVTCTDGIITNYTDSPEKELTSGTEITQVRGNADWWLLALGLNFSDGSSISVRDGACLPTPLWEESATAPKSFIYGLFGDITLYGMGNLGFRYFTIQPVKWTV